MATDRQVLAGEWREAIRQQWTMLSDDDLEAIHGQTENLFQIVQDRYSWSRSETEHQYDMFREMNGLENY